MGNTTRTRIAEQAAAARYEYNDAMYAGEMSNPKDTNPYKPGSALADAWNIGREMSYGTAA